MNRIVFKKRKGMSLVELMIYIFVMSLIIMTSVAVAISYIKGRSNIKKYQQNIEEMSLIINNMAKTLRMSNCSMGPCNFGGNTVTVYKNNTVTAASAKTVYTFDTANHKLTVAAGSVGENVMLEGVDGSFAVENSEGVPLITIEIKKTDNPKMLIRTSVSQRSGYSITP